MRLPGYFNAQAIWGYNSEVLFNDIDFPGLVLSDFEFVPAEVKKLSASVPGASGEIDLTESLTGYPTYNGIKAKITLSVRRPKEWAAWRDGIGGTTEGDFLETVNGKVCDIRFVNSNDFFLRGRPRIAEYDRFGMVWKIVLDVDCDPFWWENSPTDREVSINHGITNIIDPSTVTPVESGNALCSWSSVRNGYVLRAPVGQYATATFTGLTSSHTYQFVCRVIQGGRYEIFKANGAKIPNNTRFTGTTSLQFRMISDQPQYAACVFIEIALYDVTSGVQTVTVDTLDAPLNELHVLATASARMTLDGDVFDIPAGESVIRGLNIPPNSQREAVLTSSFICSVSLWWRRGRFSCTL